MVSKFRRRLPSPLTNRLLSTLVDFKALYLRSLQLPTMMLSPVKHLPRKRLVVFESFLRQAPPPVKAALRARKMVQKKGSLRVNPWLHWISLTRSTRRSRLNKVTLGPYMDMINPRGILLHRRLISNERHLKQWR